MSVEDLMAINEISNPDSIFVGQTLRLRIVPEREGPALWLIPDSELVYGPAYLDFDLAGFLRSSSGDLGSYQEIVDGKTLSGFEMLQRVSQEFSVGPRVMLALIEARSGWVSGEIKAGMMDYPAGLVDPARAGLWLQLNWMADRLNGGYYDLKTRKNPLITLKNGVYLGGHTALNPGSFAIHRVIGFQTAESELETALLGFQTAYLQLFGDPSTFEVQSKGTDFPDLGLPWAREEAWWMTGGPHGGWGGGSAWAALDFVPPGEERGCFVSDAWTVAVADGLLLDGAFGEVLLDLDGDGTALTGPLVQYLHLAAAGRTEGGTQLRAGDRIGHPSCEGGFSEATHLHIARRLDGEWLAADDPESPFTMAGWTAQRGPAAYEGSFVHSDERRREACECRLPETNGIEW